MEDWGWVWPLRVRRVGRIDDIIALLYPYGVEKTNGAICKWSVVWTWCGVERDEVDWIEVLGVAGVVAMLLLLLLWPWLAVLALVVVVDNIAILLDPERLVGRVLRQVLRGWLIESS